MKRLAATVSSEFCVEGYTTHKNVSCGRCSAVGFTGALKRALDATFCSVHLFTALRELFKNEALAKYGYIDGSTCLLFA